MHSLLQESLSELRLSTIVLGPVPGSGGAENLFSVAVQDEIDEPQLVEFLREAQSVRYSQVAAGDSSVVFYVWHDEMAGQIRFSVARGTAFDLPFAAPVVLVHELSEIVRSYVNSEYGRGIPWEELEVAHLDVDDDPAVPAVPAVRVWATQLK